jgi:electron transfer flavoprotein alpha subunit
MANVLAVAEQRDGALRKVSEEAVSAAWPLAQAIGGQVHAVVLGGKGTAAAAGGLGKFGAEKVFAAEHEAFTHYAPEAFTTALVELVRANGYHTVVFAASALGKDLAPRVAARLDAPLAADATELAVEGDDLIVTRPMYGGRAFARVSLEGQPRLVSVRPNVFRARENAGAGAVETLDTAADAGRVRVIEVKAASGDALDVGEAPIVVSGGRGMKGPENWHLLEALRDALGSNAALGASRAVVDAGWRPHAEQVGQTGKTVSPQLYFAVAISGAMQHLAGMRSAKTIVAINKDADAPIFKVADYGLVGDVNEILPALAAEIGKSRG